MCCLLLAVAVTAARGDMKTRNLNVMSGLSSGYVLDMTEDRRGFMWFATQQGLDRFDGNSFINFNTENSGLSANELNAVMVNPANPDELWIGTQRHGLCIMNLRDNTIKAVPMDKVLSRSITKIKPASDGSLLLVHYHDGVEKMDPVTLESKVYGHSTLPGLPHKCWTAMDDGMGHLYIGHVSGGLSIVNLADKTFRNLRDLPGNSVYSICLDRRGNLWLGTEYGAAKYNPVTGEIEKYIHSAGNANSIAPGKVMDIREAEDGNIWFSTSEGGISIIDAVYLTDSIEGNIRFRTLSGDMDDGGTSSPYMYCLYQDTHGNMWAGSTLTGVDFMGKLPEIFSRLPYKFIGRPVVSYRPVWSCSVSGADGSVWLGSANAIARFSRGNMTEIPLPRSDTRSHAVVRGIMADSKNRIWVATSDRGLLVYNPSSGSFSEVTGIPDDVRVLTEARGAIVAGTVHGLFQVDQQLKAHPLEQYNSKLNDLIVNSLWSDGAGRLWVGTFGRGLAVFDRDGRMLKMFDTFTDFPSNAVNTIKGDKQGRVWVGTRNGLIMFPSAANLSEYRVFNSQQGIKGHVEGVEEDFRGGIWVSTSQGLSRLDDSGNRFVLYKGNSDLPLNSFMENASAKDEEGNIYFGSSNGVFKVSPRNIYGNKDVDKAVVTDFLVYNTVGSDNTDYQERIPVPENKVELPHDRNTFRIFFNVLDFGKAPMMDYEYNLSGLDDSWTLAEGDNSAVYRNLPPGKYEFRIRQRIKGQTWGDPYTALTIVIELPFWLTWYAKIFYVLLTLAIVFFVGRFIRRWSMQRMHLANEREQARQKQALNEEKLKFYTNITHELRTPLTLITGPLEDLEDDPDLPPKYSTKIKLIHESSLRLLSLVNGILDFRKTETQNRKLSVRKGNLSNLLREIGIRYRELNRNTDLQIVLDIESNDHNIYYDGEVVTTIVENLMSNAVKYTPKGEVKLSLHTIEEDGTRYSEIKVSDTGYGISAKGLPHIFERYYQTQGDHQASGTGIGLALVKNLVELHHASIHVTSQVNKGSVFTVRLQTDYVYPDNVMTDEKGEEETEAAEIMPESTTGRLRVLVVEDNLDICQYVQDSMSDEYDVFTANNGWEGLKKTAEVNPDIIISDIMMPELDGLAMTRKLKADIHTSHIPVIILTAKDTITDKETGYESGADSYLTKPFSAKLLRSRIRNIMEGRRKLAASLLSRPAEALADGAGNEKVTEDTREQAMDKLNPIDRKFMERVDQVINENIANQDLGVPFLADKMCVSAPTLYRKMTALLGMSANEYIRHLRLQKAVRLMDLGEHTVSEIVTMAGFGSHSSFAKAFKKEYGCSATNYMTNKQSQKI